MHSNPKKDTGGGTPSIKNGRSSSKTITNTPVNKYSASPLNTQTKKATPKQTKESPQLSKVALELVNKISDDRLKEINNINKSDLSKGGNKDKDFKQPLITRPKLPIKEANDDKSQPSKYNNFLSNPQKNNPYQAFTNKPINNHTQYNGKVIKQKNLDIMNLMREKAAIKIQRCYMRYTQKNLDPKSALVNLLKRTKMNALKKHTGSNSGLGLDKDIDHNMEFNALKYSSSLDIKQTANFGKHQETSNNNQIDDYNNYKYKDMKMDNDLEIDNQDNNEGNDGNNEYEKFFQNIKSENSNTSKHNNKKNNDNVNNKTNVTNNSNTNKNTNRDKELESINNKKHGDKNNMSNISDISNCQVDHTNPNYNNNNNNSKLTTNDSKLEKERNKTNDTKLINQTNTNNTNNNNSYVNKDMRNLPIENSSLKDFYQPDNNSNPSNLANKINKENRDLLKSSMIDDLLNQTSSKYFKEEDPNALNLSNTERELNELNNTNIDELMIDCPKETKTKDENLSIIRQEQQEDSKSKFTYNDEIKERLNNISKMISKADYDEEDSVNFMRKEDLFATVNPVKEKKQIKIPTDPNYFSKKENKDYSSITNTTNNDNKSSLANQSALLQEEKDSKINQIFEMLENNQKYDYNNDNLDKQISLAQNNSVPNSAEVLNIVLELKENKKTLSVMKEIIEELKSSLKKNLEFYKKDTSEKLSIQKHEYDTILNKQQNLIENLVLEKKKLANQMEEMNEELNKLEKNDHRKMQQMMENFEIEMKKNKDAWFQAEKIRRKKWEDSKVKEIKDNTIKGLEPELDKILHNHKQEMLKLEEKQQDDLRKQKEKHNNDYERRINDLKDRFLTEKEEAIDHERTLASQRARNQVERLEEEYNEDRRRWNSSLTQECQRLETLREKDKKLFEDQLSKIEERYKNLFEEKDNYYNNKIVEIEKRQTERSRYDGDDLKLKYEKEREKFTEDKTRELENKFKELKLELNKDRDKQLQLIVEKLSEDTMIEKKKLQSDAEHKADIINKQLKIEIEQLRHKVPDLTDKLAGEAKVRTMLDENLESMSRKMQEMQRELSKKDKHLLEQSSNLSDLNSKYSSLAKDFNKEKHDIESEYRIKSQKYDTDSKILGEKFESLKSHYENKINDVQKYHKEEIEMIESKIKKALQKKDESLKKFQDDNQLKEITIQKLEELLAKQRKELLMNN